MWYPIYTNRQTRTLWHTKNKSMTWNPYKKPAPFWMRICLLHNVSRKKWGCSLQLFNRKISCPIIQRPFVYCFCYLYSANTILMWLMKDRTDACVVKTIKGIYEYLGTCKCKTKIHMLDNKFSIAVQQYIKPKQVNMQLFKPHYQFVNASKPAIKASKYHIITGL